MTEYRLDRIEPTYRNAQSAVQLTGLDLWAAGAAHFRDIANYSDLQHIKRQQQRFAQHPERYMGALDDEDHLLGLVKYNDWNWYDQQPFEPLLNRVLHRLDRRQQDEAAPQPLGVFALLVHTEFVPADQRFDIGTDLLDVAIGVAQEREMRIVHYPDDEMKQITVAAGFYPSGKTGSVLGIRQELYVRPSKFDDLEYSPR